MTKKELCEQYIETNLQLDSIENTLSDALSLLNQDNSLIGIVPEDYKLFVDQLFRIAVGESNQDWTDYWLYECDATGPTSISIDNKDYIVNSFNELWLLVGED